MEDYQIGFETSWSAQTVCVCDDSGVDCCQGDDIKIPKVMGLEKKKKNFHRHKDK